MIILLFIGDSHIDELNEKQYASMHNNTVRILCLCVRLTHNLLDI